MKVTILLDADGAPRHSEIEVVVAFENDTATSEEVPFGRMLMNGSHFGVRIREVGGSDLQPVEFKNISPSGAPSVAVIGAGHSESLHLKATIQEKRDGLLALAFQNATYRLECSKRYTFSFHWGPYKSSNEIDWVAPRCSEARS